MERLQSVFSDAIKQALQEYFEPESFIIALFKSRLKSKGLSLTEEQTEQIRSAIRTDSFGELRISFDDVAIEKAEVTREDLERVFTLDDDLFDKIEASLSDAIGSAFEKSKLSHAESLYSERRENTQELLDFVQEQSVAVLTDVQHYWGRSIGLLDVLNQSCIEVGSEFNQYFQQAAEDSNDLVFEALVRLHARACQTTSEIICLLKNGFADGAHARWRTLHEIAVIMIFVMQHGSDIAERFLLHSYITDFKDMDNYKKHHEKLGYPPVSEEVHKNLQDNYNELVKRYGNKYAGDYGWASTVLKDPNFKNIEASVTLDHLRPLYRMANINVHAGAKGSIFRLGLSERETNFLLAGPSVSGLTDPGENTAYSIALCTAELLLIKPSLDTYSIAEAIIKLRDDVVFAFREDEERMNEGSEDNMA